jgi:hypothetical protein
MGVLDYHKYVAYCSLACILGCMLTYMLAITFLFLSQQFSFRQFYLAKFCCPYNCQSVITNQSYLCYHVAVTSLSFMFCFMGM